MSSATSCWGVVAGSRSPGVLAGLQTAGPALCWGPDDRSPHSPGAPAAGPRALLGPLVAAAGPALGSGRPTFIWCLALGRVCGFVNCWVSGISLRREVSPSREQLMRRERSRPGEGSGHVRVRRVVHIFKAQGHSGLTSQNHSCREVLLQAGSH